jgi:uncharacterized iron-regulated membrane protein
VVRNEIDRAEEQGRRVYRAVWRWHFYAGLFCIPFVIWLACTGSIYLFKPQIERRLDRLYDHLAIRGVRASPERIASTAIASVPGATLHYYELPPDESSAVRVIVGLGKEEYRVYIHPQTLEVLKIVNENNRPMRIIFRMHGELLAGNWGSRFVELAASWAIVLIVSGLYLWWPRQSSKFAGVIWIRLNRGSRVFWRDLHAVTGIWISALALFLLLTGLAWAKNWGTYLKKIRQVTGTSVAHQDWTTGSASDSRQRETSNDSISPEAEHSEHMRRTMNLMTVARGYAALDRLVPAAKKLGFAAPVLVIPPAFGDDGWTVKSDSQNRPLRSTVVMSSQTGEILRREDFAQRHLIDRIIGVGIAAHEGQLFGVTNQLLGLATAMGLVTLSLSATILWWRRRAVGVLGAPLPTGKPRWSFILIAFIAGLALYLPAMTASLVVVLLLEKLIFARIPPISRWLGLSTDAACST